MFADDEFRKARLAILIAFLINGFSVGNFVSRIPDFKYELEISNGILGASLLCASLGVLTALRPTSRAAAKYGSGPVTKYSAFTLGLALPLIGLLFNLPWFLFSLFIYGVLSSTHDLSINAHAAALENKAGKRLMSTFHAMWSIGGLTGGAIGGLLASFKVSILIHAIVIGSFIFLVSLFTRNWFLPAEADQHVIEKHTKRKTPRRFLILGLLGLCGALGEGAASDWGGVLARDTFEASTLMSALPYVFFSATMVIGRFSGDFLAHKFGVVRLLTWSGFIAGTGLMAGLFAGNIYGVIIGWLLLGIGISTVIPMMISATGTLANEKYSGQVSAAEGVALVTGVAYFGFVVGPPLIGFMSEIVTLRWAMLLPAVLAIIFGLSAKKVLS
ncbi:MAG: MFS transporter [Actinomycetes bacterium]